MGILDVFLQSPSYVSVLGALVVLVLVYIVSSSSFSSQGDRKEPPGPRPLPLLGNLLLLDLKRPYNTLLKLSKKYGSVFTVYFGPEKVVVLAGYKTVKEALVNHADEFGERRSLLITEESTQGHGVLWSNGDSWKEMRRFSLTNLRDFGMGKRACEDKIIEECEQLLEVFKKFKGEAFDTTQSMNYAVSNIICSIVYGSRFEYSDPTFTSMVDQTNKRIQLVGSPSVQMYNLFPWLFKFIRDRKEIHEITDFLERQNVTLFSQLKETLNPQMCRGFVDTFLAKKQNLEESGITNSYFHDDNLMITVLNLFAAGTDTTATTLRWALLFMAKYPNIQDQVQEEVDRVIGSRQVQVEDRKNLPFTDAVIHETQRLANIVPMAVPHRTSQDVTFKGYFIKKGTTVYPLLTSVLYDETEWESPRSFNPAHFLDKDGKFVKRDAFMPFSAVVLVLVYIVSSSSFSSQAKEKEPPGPRPLPLLGNLLQLDLKRPYNTLMEFSKKYGSVFTIYLGPKKVVVLAGYKTVKEALVNCADEFGDRDEIRILHECSPGNGVIWSNGDSWKELRRFALTNLRDFGMGKKACEDKIIEECEHLTEVFMKFKADFNMMTQNYISGKSNKQKFPALGDAVSTDQVQEEVDRVIGGRQVQVEDRKNLPFTNAVIHETQRLANIVPMALPHRTSQDVTFQGYFIKKGTTVYPLLTSVLYDETEWESPRSFNPAHFLEKDGKFVKRDAFMPFSAEGLAKMELFIFFTTLLQHFRFSPPPGVSEDDLDLTPRVGATLNPSPHKLCAVSRM
ncbi:Cytochrome P450 2K1 [Nibea albiflora]|uniref:Cytochrome P450 2K1 n=1 Tax=Nibea albiflora TaxID=240163 RepID=A0ACB7FBA4_NIBAL|nr:Cytochrome P450 2K1 [Nibea albiflora]